MTPAMPYRSVQRVYFDDLDALNILHNVRYVLFMERARSELFRALGHRWEDPATVNPDRVNVVAENTIRYLRPVRGEGDVCVLVRPTHLGTSSLVLDSRVCSLDCREVYSEGTTRLVRLDGETYRPAPWSDGLRALVAPLVGPLG